MQTRGCVTLLVLGAWLAHASFAGEPAAPPKSGDSLRAAADAHARAKAQRRKELAADRAKAQARLDAALQKNDADRQAALQAQATRVQEAAGVQARSYLEPFRERLDVEIHYIERTCGLTDDQAAALRKHGAEIIESAQTDLAKSLAAQAGQPRQAVVIVNGNAVAVPAGVNGEYLTDPAQAARHELQRFGALTPEAQAKLDDARRRDRERALRAARLAVLATLDEALLLSHSQRRKIAELLDIVWDLPLAARVNPYLDDAGVSPQATALLHDVCLVLPDAELHSLLRPAQQAHWKTLSVLVSQVHANQPRRLLNVPGGLADMRRVAEARRAAARVPGRARIEVRAQPERLVFNGLMAGGQRIVAQQPGAVGNIVLPTAETLLDLVVDDVATACELSDDQRTKLNLAGQLDLKRVGRPLAGVAEGAGVNHEAGLVGQVREVEKRFGGNAAKVMSLDLPLVGLDPRLRTSLFNESSAFQKVLTGRLTAAQIERLAAAERERRALRDQATVAAVVQAIDECLLLSAEQHRQLSEFFKQQLASRPNNRSTRDRPGIAAEQLGRISARDLEPMFDDVQRPMVARFWQELWARIPVAAGPVLELREAR